MKSPGFQIFLFASMLLLVASSCTARTGRPPATETPALETITPASSPERLASPTPPQPQPSLSAPEPCAQEVCILDGTFLIKRPVSSAVRDVIDATSRYGTLRRGVGDVYHGVQFLNSLGTPVYAAAAGDVEVAGDDSQVSYGSRPGMYGNLVILKHSLPGIPAPVYTLYAHLSEVSVKAEGDVEAGEQIGLVGMSGSVRGSTLYFEMRYGENSYAAAVNPELWLEPLTDQTGDPMGALAGKVIDDQGNYVTLSNIQVEN